MGVLKNDVGRPSNKTIMIRNILKIVGVLLIVGVVFALAFFFKGKEEKVSTNSSIKYANYRIKSNSLEAFDLYFMQLENNRKNMVYSPLSIKYALRMLEEGANGETKDQISNIIGEYKSTKYTNSSNMSFANAMFVRDSYKEQVKEDYINKLKNKYGAEVVYDSFKTPDAVNNWVSNKTLKLIDNLLDKAPDNDFLLVNALAIDMEWVKKIQSEDKMYFVTFPHRDFTTSIDELTYVGHHELKFEDASNTVKSVEIGAVANRYDIVNELGEANIRKTITEEYTAWLNGDERYGYSCGVVPTEEKTPEAIKKYVDNFLNELGEGYKEVTSSTDFYFNDTEDIKVFAKDLKTYNNQTLQYVGIMPKKVALNEYVKDAKADGINEIISNMKPIELNSFKDGVVTHITGYIPVFNYDYELKLEDDLKTLGIKNIFDAKKADLTNLAKGGATIDKTLHKATIDFSNDGIKAAAVTVGGGKGDGGCGFDHIYKMPVEEINLTFDKPYMYIIRDKDTGEVWFMGTVYEPTKYTPDAQANW